MFQMKKTILEELKEVVQKNCAVGMETFQCATFVFF